VPSARRIGAEDLRDVRAPAVSVAKRFTVPVNGTQRRTQFFSIRAGLRADAGPHGTHVPDDASYDKVRFTAGEDRRVLQLKFTIASKCLGLGRAAGHFRAPWFDRFRCAWGIG
jgi:hypothetical protein